MAEKYHLESKSVAPRLPKIGKCGVVDWREDCAGCHNCVKKACVYDRYRQEGQYIRSLNNVDSLFFECMGCFSCVQSCTKGLLSLSINPVYEGLGNSYWIPDIIQTTWAQAETGKIPVSGAGYRGKFTGEGFDSMWTDMSEIVRPTRDGIHGREYISTNVDIGRKPSLLNFEGSKLMGLFPPIVEIPMPMIIDLMPSEYRLPKLIPIFAEVAMKTGLLMVIDIYDLETLGGNKEKYSPNLVLYLSSGVPLPSKELLQKVRMVEISDGDDAEQRIKELKKLNSGLVVAIRIELNTKGEDRAVELAQKDYSEVLHLVADVNGNQIGVDKPKFIKDMVRHIHSRLVKQGMRDEITIIAGGGIALAEHMAKQLICGADVVSVNLPLLIALECRLCNECISRNSCPAGIDDVEFDYGVGRVINLIAAWHDQLIEVMGAMGIREARRLRGEVGRAMFFEDIEEETFGKLFGSRKKN